MKIHKGDLLINKDNVNDFKDLEIVTGCVSIHERVKFIAPKLKTIGKYTSISYGAEFTAPKLKTIGGDVFIQSGGEFNAPKLEIIRQEVYINPQGKFVAPELEIIGKYLSLYNGAEFNVPRLEAIGGRVALSKGAKLRAERLEVVGGSVYVYRGAEARAPRLGVVGHYVCLLGGGKLEAPGLEIDLSLEGPLIAEMNLRLLLWRKGFVLIDGILSKLLSEKTVGDVNVMKVLNIGDTKPSYIVERNNAFAHGNTIKKAIEDIRYKIGDRNVSEFGGWKDNLDQEISLDVAITGYRVITGACEAGVRGFINSIKVPKKLTPNVILKLTEGQYGNDTFREFLNN